MKFGIRFVQFVGSVREIISYGVAADKAGLDYVWFPHDTFMQNTWVLSSLVAAQTSRVKIGSVGINAYTCDPSEIACYLATLDEASNGRAVLGMGLHTHDMVGWTGIDASTSITRTREATHIIRALLKGEVVDFKGEEFQWTDQCYLRFKPVRDEIPIYICAFGEDYLALSGEIGDGSLPMITPPASAPEMVAAIHKGIKAAGRPIEDVDISGCAWLSLSHDERVARDTMRAVISYFGPYLEDHALGKIGLSRKDFAAIRTAIEAGNYDGARELVTEDMMALGLVGTPRQVINQIEQLGDAGITHVNLGGPIGPDIPQAIKLLGDKVMPYFR
ncbi:MAG: LLM class flavin-dependent oxidoreductase [Fimbriimonadaceae bacterium]|nr:LLM class flavin-dependent oxidoreductase [Alphaproteobacteria bacterium]